MESKIYKVKTLFYIKSLIIHVIRYNLSSNMLHSEVLIAARRLTMDKLEKHRFSGKVF